MMSELGVGTLLFTVGVAVAIYFGQGEGYSLTAGMRTFLTTPIFICLMLGLSFALLQPPLKSPVFDIPFRILDVLGGSLTIFDCPYHRPHAEADTHQKTQLPNHRRGRNKALSKASDRFCDG